MNQPLKAIASYQTALREWTKLQDTARIALVNNNLGQVYHDLEQYDSALFCYQQAQQGKESTGDRQSLASTFHNMGLTYSALNRNEEAHDYLRRSHAIEKEFNNRHGQVQSCNSLAELHLKEGRLTPARHYLDTAKQLNARVGSRTTRLERWRLEADWHEAAGQYQPALRYHRQWAALRDSIFNEERLQVIEAQAETELQEETQARQQAEQQQQFAELESALQKRYTLAAIVGGGLFGLLSLAFYRLYRTNKRISERNALLVREQHHRVKNNLHVISGLLSLQSRRLDDDAAKRAMTESQGRIESMALIHQGLYGQHLTEVNMRDYLQKLVTQVVESYGYTVELTFDLEDITLDVDRAAPVGLMVNEVVTNAGKYAFPSTPQPTLYVSFRKTGTRYHLTIQDNGPGIDPDTPARANSFGMKLIHLQAKQLRGSVHFHRQDGTLFEFAF